MVAFKPVFGEVKHIKISNLIGQMEALREKARKQNEDVKRDKILHDIRGLEDRVVPLLIDAGYKIP